CGQRGKRRLRRGLPHHRVSRNQRQRRIPCPNRDREIECGNHPHYPQRMPGFHHAVVRPFRSDGQARQLPGKSDSVHTDVDHFLHFALTLGENLARFEGHQPAKCGFVGAQFFSEEANQFASLRRRNLAPFEKSLVPPLRRRARGRRIYRGYPPHRLARDGAPHLQIACREARRGYSEAFQQACGFFRDAFRHGISIESWSGKTGLRQPIPLLSPFPAILCDVNHLTSSTWPLARLFESSRSELPAGRIDGQELTGALVAPQPETLFPSGSSKETAGKPLTRRVPFSSNPAAWKFAWHELRGDNYGRTRAPIIQKTPKGKKPPRASG